METLKFKVGDKVRVKSLEWYNENKNAEGLVKDKISGIHFNESMSYFCGSILRIIDVDDDRYFYTMSGIVYYWQDWMLEDEVVTEEKQEVEQLNNNDMETKEMTQQEISEYLNDTKILCTSREESKKVQEKLFELGFSYYGEKSNVVEDSAFTLYINFHNKMQFGSDLSMWVEDDSRRVEPSEILEIQLKEEKPKFDPKSLQAFDKVLVRDSDEDYWEARFFDSYEKENGDEPYYTTNGCSYVYCIPYNEETKHLHGTTEEAPEFYKIWK